MSTNNNDFHLVWHNKSPILSEGLGVSKERFKEIADKLYDTMTKSFTGNSSVTLEVSSIPEMLTDASTLANNKEELAVISYVCGRLVEIFGSADLMSGSRTTAINIDDIKSKVASITGVGYVEPEVSNPETDVSIKYYGEVGNIHSSLGISDDRAQILQQGLKMYIKELARNNGLSEEKPIAAVPVDLPKMLSELSHMANSHAELVYTTFITTKSIMELQAPQNPMDILKKAILEAVRH